MKSVFREDAHESTKNYTLRMLIGLLMGFKVVAFSRLEHVNLESLAN